MAASNVGVEKVGGTSRNRIASPFRSRQDGVPQGVFKQGHDSFPGAEPELFSPECQVGRGRPILARQFS
jgi:hypothetical protein